MEILLLCRNSTDGNIIAINMLCRKEYRDMAVVACNRDSGRPQPLIECDNGKSKSAEPFSDASKLWLVSLLHDIQVTQTR